MSETQGFEKMVDIGSTQLRLSCAGCGTPTVVLDAGLGEGLETWTKVQTQVAAFTRVCAYDRAGVGKSGPGLKPRTSGQIVSELRTLLSRAEIEGPYVLVGHSLGGLNAQLYAIEHPDEVAGLVLVDPTFPDMIARLKPVLGKIWTPLWNSQFASDAEGMTKQDFDASCTQVATAGKLPDVPLVVLSAGQPVKLPPPLNALFPGAKLVRAMQAGHADLAKASSKGQPLIAASSTHATISQDDLIVEAIRQVVEMGRR
jgi:pimeloyl-ACP methyl ester carboxylesterase